MYSQPPDGQPYTHSPYMPDSPPPSQAHRTTAGPNYRQYPSELESSVASRPPLFDSSNRSQPPHSSSSLSSQASHRTQSHPSNYSAQDDPQFVIMQLNTQVKLLEQEVRYLKKENTLLENTNKTLLLALPNSCEPMSSLQPALPTSSVNPSLGSVHYGAQGVRFWQKASWNAILNHKGVQNRTDDSRFYTASSMLFAENEFGHPLSPTTIDNVKKYAIAIFHDLATSNLLPRNGGTWGAAGASAQNRFIAALELRFPDFKLCDNAWKSLHVATHSYTNWFTTHSNKYGLTAPPPSATPVSEVAKHRKKRAKPDTTTATDDDEEPAPKRRKESDARPKPKLATANPLFGKIPTATCTRPLASGPLTAAATGTKAKPVSKPTSSPVPEPPQGADELPGQHPDISIVPSIPSAPLIPTPAIPLASSSNSSEPDPASTPAISGDILAPSVTASQAVLKSVDIDIPEPTPPQKLKKKAPWKPSSNNTARAIKSWEWSAATKGGGDAVAFNAVWKAMSETEKAPYYAREKASKDAMAKAVASTSGNDDA
ncbi:hypothetical protein C8F01DRAFT_1267290 [Mycena amicta]|nr:hypothetical protein C8F01DRAFT_1267290 [Mycena amicta]